MLIKVFRDGFSSPSQSAISQQPIELGAQRGAFRTDRALDELQPMANAEAVRILSVVQTQRNKSA